jgi:hypothetical protein
MARRLGDERLEAVDWRTTSLGARITSLTSSRFRFWSIILNSSSAATRPMSAPSG